MSPLALLAAAVIASPPVEPSASSIVAATEVGLDGASTTELALTVRASPVALWLPAAVREVQLETEGGLRPKSRRTGDRVVIWAAPESRVRLSYRQRLPAFGFRGRFRVVLPRFERPVGELGWNVLLPGGLTYSALQASLEAAGDCKVESRPQRCFAYYVRRLSSGEAYVEGDFVQRLTR